jgi:hypothetical protein
VTTRGVHGGPRSVVTPSGDRKEIRSAESEAPSGEAPDPSVAALRAIQGPSTRDSRVAGASFRGIVGLLSRRKEDPAVAYRGARSAFELALHQGADANEIHDRLQALCDHADWSSARVVKEILGSFQRVDWPAGASVAQRYPLAYLDALDEEVLAEVTRGVKDPSLLEHLVARLADASPAIALARAKLLAGGRSYGRAENIGAYDVLFDRALGAIDPSDAVEVRQLIGLAKTLGATFPVTPPDLLLAAAESDARFFAECVTKHDADPARASELDALIQQHFDRAETPFSCFAHQDALPAVVARRLDARVEEVDFGSVETVTAFFAAAGDLNAPDATLARVRQRFQSLITATAPTDDGFVALYALADRHTNTRWALPQVTLPDPLPHRLAIAMCGSFATRDVGEAALREAFNSVEPPALARLLVDIKAGIEHGFNLLREGIDVLAARTDWSDVDAVALLLATKQEVEAGLVHAWIKDATFDGADAVDLVLAAADRPVLAELRPYLDSAIDEAPPGDPSRLKRAFDRAPARERALVFKALARSSTNLDTILQLAEQHELPLTASAARSVFGAAWDDAPALRQRLDKLLDHPERADEVIEAGLHQLARIADWSDRDTARFLWTNRRDASRSSTFPAHRIEHVLDLASGDLAEWTEALDIASTYAMSSHVTKAMTEALPRIDDFAALESIADAVEGSNAAHSVRVPVFERLCATLDPSDDASIERLQARAARVHRPIPEATLDEIFAVDPDAATTRALQLSELLSARPRAEAAIVEALRSGPLAERLARVDRVLDAGLPQVAFLRPIFDALRAEIPRDEAPNHPALQRLGWEVLRYDRTLDLPFADFVAYVSETRALDGLTGDRSADLNAAIKGVPVGDHRASKTAQVRLRHLLLDPTQTDPVQLERELTTVGRALVTTWRSNGRRGSSQRRLSAAEEAQFVEQVYQPAYDRLCALTDWSDDARTKAVLGGIDQLASRNVTITIPAKHIDDLFGHGRATDLARASVLKQHKNDAVRARAERAWTELAQTTSLGDALLMVNAREPDIRKMGQDVIDRGFTADELAAALRDPSLDFDGLAARVDTATRIITGQTRTAETEAMVERAIAPALDRLCAQADFTDAKHSQALAQLPVAYAAQGYTLDFPAQHASALHAGVPNPRDLILHPTAAVRGIEVAAVRARFTAATDIAQRRQVHAELEATLRRAPRSTPASQDRAAWQRAIADAVTMLDGDVQTLKTELTDALLDEARAHSDTAAVLRDVQQVLPPSIERDALLDALVPDGWNDRALLDTVTGYGRKTFSSARAEVLRDTIGSFPGDVASFLAFLRGELSAADLVAQEKLAPEDTSALERLRAYWAGYGEGTQKAIFTSAVEQMLTRVEQRDPVVEQVARDRGFASARALVDDVLDQRAFSVIAADPDGAKIIDDVRTVLDALPVAIRARIFSTVLLEPPTQDAPDLLKRLMVSAGAVAIKVGQQLSEDPSVPLRFRVALEDVRDQNERMTPLGVWSRIPHAQRPKIAALGPTLGTGSIKQVLLVRPDASLGISADEELVAAVVRDGVQADIDGSVQALDVLPHLRHVGRRVKPMLERELDLPGEERAFAELAASAVGPLVDVPQVVASDHHFLMRRSTGGKTIAQISRARKLTTEERGRIEALHVQLVRAALDTRSDFIRDGKTFVLTDPHDANVSDNGARLGLFDPGQFENLTPEEGDLFVRLLAAFSRDKWQQKRKAKLVAQLMTHASIGDPNDGDQRTLEERLVAAYDGLTTGQVSQKLEAFFLDASKNGVAIPNSYFGVAKMLNTLTAREAEQGLGAVTEDTIKSLYLDQLGPFGRIARPFA